MRLDDLTFYRSPFGSRWWTFKPSSRGIFPTSSFASTIMAKCNPMQLSEVEGFPRSLAKPSRSAILKSMREYITGAIDTVQNPKQLSEVEGFPRSLAKPSRSAIVKSMHDFLTGAIDKVPKEDTAIVSQPIEDEPKMQDWMQEQEHHQFVLEEVLERPGGTGCMAKMWGKRKIPTMRVSVQKSSHQKELGGGDVTESSPNFGWDSSKYRWLSDLERLPNWTKTDKEEDYIVGRNRENLQKDLHWKERRCQEEQVMQDLIKFGIHSRELTWMQHGVAKGSTITSTKTSGPLRVASHNFSLEKFAAPEAQGLCRLRPQTPS
jgi:hypothetical protein